MSKGIKKALSLALCVVMLVSCWVFTAPATNAATAGTYYVEIDVYVKTATDGYSNTYAAPFFGTSTSSYKNMAGITLLYKEDNGTKDAGADSNADKIYDNQRFENFGLGSKDEVTEKNNSATKPNIGNNAGNHTLTATISGFPTAFAVYNNRSGSFYNGWGEWSVKEIRVGASASSTLTSIWKGNCYTSNRDGGYPARWIVKHDGTVERWDSEHMTIYNNRYSYDGGGTFYVWNEAYNGGDPDADLQYQNSGTDGNNNNCQMYTDGSNNGDDYIVGSNAETYKRAWAMPRPTTITDITGAASVNVNTDGTTANTASYTLGTVKDQYGVDWYQDAEWDAASTLNGVTFSNGTLSVPASANRSTDYTVTLNEKCGDAANSKTVTINTFDYNVNFYDEDGTTLLDTRTVDYGASAPAPTATKAYDSANHYVFDEWEGDSFTNITSGAQNKTATASYTTVPHTLALTGSYNDDGHTLACSGCAYTTQEAHNMSEDVSVITAPTCTATGTGTVTCEDCAYSTNTTIPAAGHSFVESVYNPEDGTDNTGAVYFTCENCDSCWSATYDSSQNKYVTGEECASESDAIAASDPVPSPAFNLFYDATISYDYGMRGAALKICDPHTYTDMNTRQHLRFTASMLVPEGVSYYCGEGGNCITDFGYVYSQTDRIGGDISNLYDGAPDVHKMSVASNNAANGNYDGSNWAGVSTHDDTYTDGTALTFNLVIKIKAYNWTKDYCARAYITYTYNGHSYTVYDSDYASRNVLEIAEQVVDNEDETLRVRNYCQSKILNNYQAAIAEKAEWDALHPGA